MNAAMIILCAAIAGVLALLLWGATLKIRREAPRSVPQTPPRPEWKNTRRERWRVAKSAGDWVEAHKEILWVDMLTGAEEWRPKMVYGYRRSWPESRMFSLDEWGAMKAQEAA